ncbi:hypothetical protein [Mesorhizobium sp. CAU 1741]|uniref:phage head spike fiber domain-containing protein n=1 Tax=Mesorhizobium sp. CAU 1741 TaxID=3140366 RepID=UPI00325AABFA
MLGVDLATRPSAALGWWPADATSAADFVTGRYMRGGAHVAGGAAFAYSRTGAGWATDSAGAVHAFGDGDMRLVDRGLCLEQARTRLSFAPLAIGASPWTAMGATVLAVLGADGAFPSPCRIGSDGTLFARRNSGPMELATGQTVRIKVRYRAGTSGQFGIYMQTGGTASLFQGPVGNLVATTTSAGGWADATNTDLGDGLHEVEADFIAGASETNWMLGVSPRSDTFGQYVDVLGAMVADGGGTTEWIFGDPGAAVTREADQLEIHLPAGTHDLTLGFDDAADQAMEGLSGDVSLDPAALGGRFLRSCVARAA